MTNAAKSLFESLKSFRDILRLADEAEPESLFLECKSPSKPRLNQDTKLTLSKALSGFSNTSGGIMVWGASTTSKSHSGLDIITQIEPIANCSEFSTHVSNTIPTLTVPSILTCENKVLKKRTSDTRGIVVTYIPPHTGDPIQSAVDEYFYFRSGDEFVHAPYQMIKRLFASTETPLLSTAFPPTIVEVDEQKYWKIPIVIQNESSAVGENVVVQVEALNSSSCKNIQPIQLRDVSNINPGKKIFSSSMSSVLHRGLPTMIGSIRVQMNGGNKVVNLAVNLFANKMIAKQQRFRLRLVKDKFVPKFLGEKLLY